MTTGPDDTWRRLRRAGLLVIISTIVLTLSFLGLLGVFSSQPGMGNRFPFYVVAGGAYFVISLLILEHRLQGGLHILAGTVG
ncbi:MAG: hypothetical protein ABEI52_04780, partial [Halobacteriaceae archaeon]